MEKEDSFMVVGETLFGIMRALPMTPAVTDRPDEGDQVPVSLDAMEESSFNTQQNKGRKFCVER